MARDTHYTYAVIRLWDEKGFIPGKEQQRLLDLAYDLGHDLSVTEFFAHLVDPAERATQSTAAQA